MQISKILYRPWRNRIAKNNFRPGGNCFSPAPLAAEFKYCVDATFDDQELQQLNRFGERTARMLMRGAARIL